MILCHIFIQTYYISTVLPIQNLLIYVQNYRKFDIKKMRKGERGSRGDRCSFSFSEIKDNSGDAHEEDKDDRRTQAKRERKKRGRGIEPALVLVKSTTTVVMLM